MGDFYTMAGWAGIAGAEVAVWLSRDELRAAKVGSLPPAARQRIRDAVSGVRVDDGPARVVCHRQYKQMTFGVEMGTIARLPKFGAFDGEEEADAPAALRPVFSAIRKAIA